MLNETVKSNNEEHVFIGGCKALWTFILMIVAGFCIFIGGTAVALAYPLWGPVYHLVSYFRNNGRPKIRLWYVLVLPFAVLYGLFMYECYLSWVSF